MLSLAFTLVNKYISKLKMALWALSYAATFYAAWHVQSLRYEAREAKELSKQQSETIKTIEKVQYVRVKNAALPVGASADVLLRKWARD
jgi:hypothetical protein